jgi:hypothetical protein
LLRQFPDIVAVVLLGVAAHQSAEAGVGFDDAAVDAEVASFEQAVGFETFEDFKMGGVKNTLRQPLAKNGETGMVRRSFGEAVAEQAANGEAVGAACGDAAVAAEAFEEADDQHFEEHDGIDGRASAILRAALVVRLAEAVDAFGEAHSGEHGIELCVEAVLRPGDHCGGRNPVF